MNMLPVVKRLKIGICKIFRQGGEGRQEIGALTGVGALGQGLHRVSEFLLRDNHHIGC